MAEEIIDAPDMAALAAELDASDMLGHLRNFARDIAGAWDAAPNWDLAGLEGREWRGVLCLGMGGSASGGDFLGALANHEGNMPFIAHRSYGLPAWVDANWLVIATSYSGNTEETLDAAKAALDAGLSLVALSTGGGLQGLAESAGAPWIQLPSGQPPRSAFGHIFGAQFALAERLGLLPEMAAGEKASLLADLGDVLTSCDFTAESDEIHPLTEVAISLLGREVAVHAASELGPAAYRCMCQINENSGAFARAQVVPEMNHNEAVAWGETYEDQAMLLFTWEKMHTRVGLRIDWAEDNIVPDPYWRFECVDGTLIGAMLHAVVIMDWLSCALALLRGKDPTAIGPITALKSHLAQ